MVQHRISCQTGDHMQPENVVILGASPGNTHCRVATARFIGRAGAPRLQWLMGMSSGQRDQFNQRGHVLEQ